MSGLLLLKHLHCTCEFHVTDTPMRIVPCTWQCLIIRVWSYKKYPELYLHDLTSALRVYSDVPGTTSEMDSFWVKSYRQEM